MTLPDHRQTINITLILLPFVMLFATGLYKSANRSKKPYQVFKHQVNHGHQISRQVSAASVKLSPAGRVQLKKDQKIFINNTGLVFKGISQGVVYLELYLLELDPDTPYLLKFHKKSLKEGIWVENAQCLLVSVNKKILGLEVDNSF